MDKINDKQLKKELPFDLYGRYAAIRDVINRNRNGNEKFRVLDVGGRGNMLKHFLPDDAVFYLDPFIDSGDVNFIKGDGCAMALEDESFDWVTSADVFEHIPEGKRKDFLSENIRVAKKGVLLAAPFYDPAVAQSEINANENYKELNGGDDHLWLKEHIENGLPDPNIFEGYLKSNGLSFQKIHNNRLFLWQILLGFEFLAEKYHQKNLQQDSEDFNYFYNTNVAPYDNQEPSYRKIYFIKKQGYLKDIDVRFKGLDDGLFLETIKRRFSFMNQVHSANESEYESLLQRAKEQDGELKFIKSSKFWKLRNRYMKLRFFRVDYFRGLCVKSIGVFKRDGLGVFVKSCYKYILYGREYFQAKSSTDADYRLWIDRHELYDKSSIVKEITFLKYQPTISIITPVYNVDPKWLDCCVQSVKNQSYFNWELCLYDDASTRKETLDCLKRWNNVDSRIKIRFGKNNGHISAASNEAIKMATGTFIALLDNDDELSPHALYEVVKLLNEHPEADLIYSDEDKLTLKGERTEPFFKPDWSLDFLLSANYICHLGVYRKSIIDEIGGFRLGYEGSQDYDLVLRFVEKTTHIFHISKILYHWRKVKTSTASNASAKNYAYTVAQRALTDYLHRNDIRGSVEMITPGFYRIKRVIEKSLKVSIIIPFRDQCRVLKRCVRSILKNTDYPNYEIILVDNQSVEMETLSFLKNIEDAHNTKVRVISYDSPFNYSAINNFAVERAEGEYILLLNNDTEVINRDWLSSMVEHIQREDVGVVGSRLYFPNDTVQHAGVVMGLSFAGHAFKYFPRGSFGYFGMLVSIRNYSAVTGACLLTKKALYKSIGGLNEKELAIAYNDVDYCLRVINEGYLIVYTPHAELYHYESLSRGNDNDADLKQANPEKFNRVMSEREYMTTKWKDVIANDPYYNINLTRVREDFGL